MSDNPDPCPTCPARAVCEYEDTCPEKNPPRSENAIVADLDTVNEVLENIRPAADAEPLNRARKRLEAELAAARIARRTANLNPRFASILASSPLLQPILAAGETSLEREGREENLRIKVADKFSPRPEPNSEEDYHQWDLRLDAERDQKAAREEAWQE